MEGSTTQTEASGRPKVLPGMVDLICGSRARSADAGLVCRRRDQTQKLCRFLEGFNVVPHFFPGSLGVTLEDGFEDPGVMALSALKSSRKLLRFGNPLGQKLPDVSQKALQNGIVGSFSDGKVKIDVELGIRFAFPCQARLEFDAKVS